MACYRTVMACYRIVVPCVKHAPSTTKAPHNSRASDGDEHRLHAEGNQRAVRVALEIEEGRKRAGEARAANLAGGGGTVCLSKTD